MMELLSAYGSIGFIWLVYCICFSYLCSGDKEISRMLIRGFWFAPIWPLVVAYGLGYGLHLVWLKAEWGK